MMMLKKFDEEHHSLPEYIANMRNNIDRLNFITLQNKRENQLLMKETYDSKVTPFRFFKGQRCYLYDPVAKVGDCYKIQRRWKRPFLVSKISSHNVNLYNPASGKYIKKSVHINRIKPSYQQDDVPKEDELIEDLLIVEVTYPRIFQARTTSATDQQNTKSGSKNRDKSERKHTSNTEHRLSIANSGTTHRQPRIHQSTPRYYSFRQPDRE